MDKTKWPAISGLVAGTVLLARNVPTTYAFDKPIHTGIIILASCAAAVIGLSRSLPKEGGRSHRGQQYDALPLGVQQYDALPLGEVGQPHGSRESSPSPEDVRYPSSLRKLRILFLVLVVAICLRIEAFRQVLANTQCAGQSWESLIPLALALWDYFAVQRHKKRILTDDVDSSVYDALVDHVFRPRYRYVLAAGLVSIGSMLALATSSSPASTYICAASLHNSLYVPNLQRMGTVLDFLIAYCIGHLLHQHEGRGTRSVSLRFISVGWAFLFSAVILLVIGIVYYIIVEEDRKWILALPTICTVLTIFHIGAMSTSVMATFVSVSTITTAYAWNNPHPFPPMDTGLAFITLCIAITGFAAYFHMETVSEDRESGGRSITFREVPSWLYLLLLSLFFLRTGLWAARKTTVTYHPIDMLIYEAQTQHEAYINQTSTSKTLADAVGTYKARYNRVPPPGFDHWYEYATARNSVVIDDYNSIHRDLLPFYALSAEDIRQRTWDMISNPWNDVAGISVRSGEVGISPNVMPTHRWMLDGLVDLIGHFVEYLPDMDLAFNLNDECRVAVPSVQIETMRTTGRGAFAHDRAPRNEFSTGRGEQWQLVPDQPNTETPLKELSFQRTFYDFGSVGCPSGSPARSQRAFLANWSTAADICHQPDLANLHGLYISPAAFKGAHDLYPVFSQSKAHGFNDILYPSAWNYIGKAKYDPGDEHPDVPFAEKNSSLFWRGATSEGVSPGGGQWRGMTRQRFVHLANNINGSEHPQAVLLPQGEHSLAYTQLPISELTNLLSTDVHVVDSIARCGGRDCPQQAREFAPLVPPTDFQDHWKYKYLLDLDGAGFSGRFLPFLYSHSLPFKAALFREWWDDRVTPWQHFVPLDIRGQGLWATLAYFAGLDGKANGRHVKAAAHELEGERIAERGRDWAKRVLRREDMEIYFFRLLLEWGRLTDDERDDIGFAVDVG
ncbi:hypothetical protein LTR36_003316 [Oleoguttula mirabilis]|uniref:Glycosyl transferase CAP10 domain-containing protein n=1 Tax=Oleoguttula mirabilis TaxID=1507867 RepID=A0AAV9JXG2_9PEZI|nr:hypothetical protein LTR36_003316 [Oleoguttula mirabilis]